MVEGGIDGAAGPDHGDGNVGYLTLGGGAVVAEDDQNGVVPQTGFFQIVHIFFEAIIGVAVGIVKKAEHVIASYSFRPRRFKGLVTGEGKYHVKEGFLCRSFLQGLYAFLKNKLIMGAPLGVVLFFGKVIHLFDLAKAHGAEIGTHARKLEVTAIDEGGFVAPLFQWDHR